MKAKVHYHAGPLRKMINGVEYISVEESNNILFVAKTGEFTSKLRKWKPTRGNLERDGYRRIFINGRRAPTARVVYEVFVGLIPEDKEIDHINTIRDDNRLENLHVISHRENLLNPLTRPRRRKACAINGAIGAAKLDRKVMLKNLAMGATSRKIPVIATKNGISTEYPSTIDASHALGLMQQAICHALKGRTKTCGGYTWKYAR